MLFEDMRIVCMVALSFTGYKTAGPPSSQTDHNQDMAM
jgi:hypothetical protein